MPNSEPPAPDSPDQTKTKDQLIEELADLRRRLAELEATGSCLETELCRLVCGPRETDGESPSPDEALQVARIIVEQSPAVLFRRLAGENPRLVYVSENISQWGYRARDFLGGSAAYKDIIHPADRERIGAEIREKTGPNLEEYTQEYRILTKDGRTRWVSDQTSVVSDAGGNPLYHQGIVVDITSRKLAEEELRKSERTLRRILETAGEGFVMMDNQMRIIMVNQAYCRMLGYEPEDILGKTPLDLASEESRLFLAANCERFLDMKYRKFEGTVLAKDGRPVPVLIHGNVLTDDSGRQIGNVAFVTDLTEQKKALNLAAEVQKSLLPQKAPNIPGFDIAGRSVSSDAVGGDYFDFVEQAGGRKDSWCVTVGDISGHGVDAALLMTSARAFLRMRAARPGSLAEVVSDLNRHLASDMFGTGRFMTMFSLMIDTQAKNLFWVRAGHDPAMSYLPSRGAFEEMAGEGLPLGVLADSRFEQLAMDRLEPGQILAIGTDGIWEAENYQGEMFGKQRLRDLIREKAGESASAILEAVFKAVDGFTTGVKPNDDITLVIVKVH